MSETMNNTKQTNKGDLYNLIGGVVEGYLEELSADNYMMIDHLTEVINDEVQKKLREERDKVPNPCYSESEVQKKVEEGVREFVKHMGSYDESEGTVVTIETMMETYLSNLKENNEEDCVTFHLGEDLSIHIRIDDLEEILKVVKGD